MEAIGPRSQIVVPLRARGRVLGALSLTMAESGRRYSEADLDLARDLGLRAGARGRQRAAVRGGAGGRRRRAAPRRSSSTRWRRRRSRSTARPASEKRLQMIAERRAT